MKLRIPHLKLESPNIKKHWTKAHKTNKHQAFLIKIALNAVCLPSLPLTVVIHSIRPREYDYSNLVASCKFLEDCIADHLKPGLAPGRADGYGDIKFLHRQRKGGIREYAVELEFLTPEEGRQLQIRELMSGK